MKDRGETLSCRRCWMLWWMRSERKIREAARPRRKKSGHRGRRHDGKVRLGEWELGVPLCNEYLQYRRTDRDRQGPGRLGRNSG